MFEHKDVLAGWSALHLDCVPVGFYARPLDGKWVVQKSVTPKITVGDVLSTIDGTEVKAFFRQQQKYIAGSNERAQRYNLYLLPHLFPTRFTIALVDGRNVVIDRLANKLPAERKTDPDGRCVVQDMIAFIHIPSFYQALFEQKALAYVSQFAKARTLIIDVRNNAGGLRPQSLTKALMDQAGPHVCDVCKCGSLLRCLKAIPAAIWLSPYFPGGFTFPLPPEVPGYPTSTVIAVGVI